MLLDDRERAKKILDKLEKFHDDLEVEKLLAKEQGDDLAIVEAPREIIEHFNRGKLLKAFDAVGYFLYQGAAVCESGHKDRINGVLEHTHRISASDWDEECRKNSSRGK